MPPALKTVFANLKQFLLADSPTDQETRSALNLIYMICFGAQAALSMILAIILAVLVQTVPTSASGADLVSPQPNTISLTMLFVVMFLLLPSALLIASLWQHQNTNNDNNFGTSIKKQAKFASIASTIALAVILAISVWLCVFAYFIAIQLQALLLLIIFSIVLYFVGLMATGIYVKTVNITSMQENL